MAGTTVRISEQARATLKELAAMLEIPMQAVLDQALERFRREQFFKQVNSAYAALRGDADAWQAEQAERRLWEVTLADGLDEGEAWGEDRVPKRR